MLTHASMPTCRVLIADDQAAFRGLLREVLGGMSAEIIECRDGGEAVAAFDRHQPDWAFLDWSMPVLDGLEATRAITARHPGARVVLLSVHASPGLAREAASAGARACFGKEHLSAATALIGNG